MVQFLSIIFFSWNAAHTEGDTKERELFKCVVAMKECIRGGGRHLQEVILKN